MGVKFSWFSWFRKIPQRKFSSIWYISGQHFIAGVGVNTATSSSDLPAVILAIIAIDYSGMQQQQQQQSAYQDPNRLNPYPNSRRSRTPGTPPLPDPTPQDKTPQYQGAPRSNQGGEQQGGGARKHQREEDQGDPPSAKRNHVDGGQGRDPASAQPGRTEGGGNSGGGTGGRRKYGGRASRWGDQNDKGGLLVGMLSVPNEPLYQVCTCSGLQDLCQFENWDLIIVLVRSHCM